MIEMIFILLILFQYKHFVCDYPLQTEYMLGKFKPGWDFVGPLMAHCLTHAGMTFTIAFTARAGLMFALQLAAIDFVIHFIMDRIKASPKLLGRFKSLSPSEYRSCASMASYTETTGELGLARAMGIKKLKENKYFWWALGLDQGVHHLTHYYLIYKLVQHVYYG